MIGVALRVGAFQAAALHLLPPAMTALRHQRAEVDLSVTDIQSSAVDLVARGDLDLAVLASWDAPPVVPAGLRLTGILEDPMVLAFADDHRLARGTTPVALASLAEESWVLIRGGSAAREQFDRITREAGFEPRIRFETESYDVAQALVATGYGIALVSRMGRRTGPGIAHRPVQHRAAHRTIHTCDTPMKQQTSPSHFDNLLQATAAELS